MDRDTTGSLRTRKVKHTSKATELHSKIAKNRVEGGTCKNRAGMILVILESPYAGNTPAHVLYARRCVADSLSRKEAPLASHLLYTQPGILDDTDPNQRTQGIKAGHAWMHFASRLVVYTDYGVSKGMLEGINRAESFNVPVEYRTLDS